MYKIKCPACKGTHTVKNGKRQGVQLYVCKECGYQFRNGNRVDTDTLWSLYQDRKQTMAELAEKHRISQSTIKRRLREVEIEWVQPSLTGGGFLHLDTTYWGHNWGVLLGLDEETGLPLYVAFIGHERVQDYIDAVRSIEQRGYCIRGIVIDGMQSLFSEFSAYKIQMCQFHTMEIVKLYLTKRPKLIAARELKELVGSLTTRQKNEFEDEYRKWKERWGNTLNRRTTLKSGKTQFTHKRLRSAMHSVDFYLPYLFTYQQPECKGMPNTNNKIEGTFTDLKKNLNNHSGMSKENRKRFISGFFLALKSKLEREK
jgi:Zn ribbon nucleic-acid-binding protein